MRNYTSNLWIYVDFSVRVYNFDGKAHYRIQLESHEIFYMRTCLTSCALLPLTLENEPVFAARSDWNPTTLFALGTSYVGANCRESEISLTKWIHPVVAGIRRRSCTESCESSSECRLNCCTDNSEAFAKIIAAENRMRSRRPVQYRSRAAAKFHRKINNHPISKVRNFYREHVYRNVKKLRRFFKLFRQ